MSRFRYTQQLECLFYKTKSCCRFGEKCSYAHRQVDEQPHQRSKKNDDKSAVAILKKGDWQENIWKPVFNRDKIHDRPCRDNTSNDPFSRYKNGNNLATDEIGNHRIQSDYKFKIGLQNPEGKNLGIAHAW